MQKMFMLLALMTFANCSDMFAKTKECKKEKTAQTQQDVCQDSFFIRIIKKYPKSVAAAVIVPIAVLAWQNYWLADENETFNLINRSLAAMKLSLETRLCETQQRLYEREDFIRTTFNAMNQKLDLLGLDKKVSAHKE